MKQNTEGGERETIITPRDNESPEPQIEGPSLSHLWSSRHVLPGTVGECGSSGRGKLSSVISVTGSFAWGTSVLCNHDR